MLRQTTTVLLLLTAISIPAAAQSAQMHVSVQVVANTIVTVDQQPSSVVISPDDVSRGFLDIPTAVAFRVRSNARNGYAMQFQPLPAPFSRAQVSWGATSVSVGDDGSWVTQPYQQGAAGGTMSVRLTVAPGTAPGTYAWPVAFAANSL